MRTRTLFTISLIFFLGSSIFTYLQYSNFQSVLNYWGPDFLSDTTWLHPSNTHVANINVVNTVSGGFSEFTTAEGQTWLGLLRSSKEAPMDYDAFGYELIQFPVPEDKNVRAYLVDSKGEGGSAEEVTYEEGIAYVFKDTFVEAVLQKEIGKDDLFELEEIYIYKDDSLRISDIEEIPI